jgi:hypothetical protein
VTVASFNQCESRLKTKVFSHYAYGDPMPHNAIYIKEDDAVRGDEPIAVYARCEREAGHTGKHLARHTNGWTDE